MALPLRCSNSKCSDSRSDSNDLQRVKWLRKNDYEAVTFARKLKALKAVVTFSQF